MTDGKSGAGPFESQFVEVKGSRVHFVEAGSGDPILLLHGNVTSSYLWRNVIPHLSAVGRCIAVDLVGFGRSDKPDIPYRIFDQAEYVAAFIEALDLKRLTLVLHGWGGFLGLSYAVDHPQDVRGIVLLEAILRPMRMTDRPRAFRRSFKLMRSAAGQEKIFAENYFVESVLPAGILRKLDEHEMEAYRAPFPTRESRVPVWVLASEIPIDGHPSDVHSAMWSTADKLARTTIPTLLLTFDPGVMVGPADVAWARETLPNLTVKEMGPGRHFVQEDQPEAIGKAIAEWVRALPPPS